MRAGSARQSRSRRHHSGQSIPCGLEPRTSGIVNAFWQARIQATSTGEILGNHFQPSLYDSFTTKKDKSSTFADLPARRHIRISLILFLFARRPSNDPGRSKRHLRSGQCHLYVASGVGTTRRPVWRRGTRFRRTPLQHRSDEKDTTIRETWTMVSKRPEPCNAPHAQSFRGLQPESAHQTRPPSPPSTPGSPHFRAPLGRDYVVSMRVWANTPYGVVAAVTSTL